MKSLHGLPCGRRACGAFLGICLRRVFLFLSLFLFLLQISLPQQILHKHIYLPLISQRLPRIRLRRHIIRRAKLSKHRKRIPRNLFHLNNLIPPCKMRIKRILPFRRPRIIYLRPLRMPDPRVNMISSFQRYLHRFTLVGKQALTHIAPMRNIKRDPQIRNVIKIISACRRGIHNT